MPTELDRARIDAAVQAVADRLAGDWLPAAVDSVTGQRRLRFRAALAGIFVTAPEK